MSQGGDLRAFTLALAETVMRSKKAMIKGGLKGHARRLARSTQPMPDFPANLVASLDGGPKPTTVGRAPAAWSPSLTLGWRSSSLR